MGTGLGRPAGNHRLGGHIIFTALNRFVSRLGGDQRGIITIAELSIVTLIAVPVLAAVGSFSLIALKSQAATAGRKETVALERNVLGRITRELRTVADATPGPGSAVVVATRPDSSRWIIDCTVHDSRAGHQSEYVCSQSDLTAASARVNTTQIAEGVVNQNIFTRQGSYLSVNLQVRPFRNRRVVTLQDGVVFRNATA